MLYLVIDDSSGEATTLVLANNEAHAIECARKTLDGDGEPSDLRAVSAHTAKGAEKRALLRFWDAATTEAMDRGNTPQSVEDELNALHSLLDAVSTVARRERDAAVAAERAALRAEIESRSADAMRANGEPSTRGFAAGFEVRALDGLVAWLGARKDGAK
jgi:hypothetical protein